MKIKQGAYSVEEKKLEKKRGRENERERERERNGDAVNKILAERSIVIYISFSPALVIYYRKQIYDY